MASKILVARAFGLGCFGDGVVNFAAAHRVVQQFAVVLHLLGDAGQGDENIEVAGCAGQRLVAIFERLRQVAGTLVVLRKLPVSIGHCRRIGRELLEEIRVHGQLLLVVRLFGDRLQPLIFRCACRNRDAFYLRVQERDKEQQNQQHAE